MFRRNKAHGINMPEARKDKLLDVLGLVLGWNKIWQPLPRIPGALNYFHRRYHLSPFRVGRKYSIALAISNIAAAKSRIGRNLWERSQPHRLACEMSQPPWAARRTSKCHWICSFPPTKYQMSSRATAVSNRPAVRGRIMFAKRRF